MSQALPERAEVVVVGGGVIGASIAFHLARAGVGVVVVEAGRLGSGSSGKPIGGLRAQFSDSLNIALGARSLAAYRRFADEPGGHITMDEVGYLFVLRTTDEVDRFASSVALQQELGVPSRMLDADEARRLCPVLETDGVLGAAFSPEDAHARPAAVVAGYVAGARRHGAVVVESCPVTGIDVVDGEVRGVVTEQGTIATTTVVCAAGAWSRAIGAMAGVELDVTPLRRQIALSPPLEPRAPRLPFTIDYGTTAYFHNADDGVLLGMSDRAQAPGFLLDYDEAWLPALRAAIGRTAPALAGVPLTTGWAGLYEQTPDANALIGEAPHVGRFLYATGYSGHGFVQAPATGEVVRDLVLGRTPFVDVTALRAERFAERAPVAEANIV